ncbi:hypothetical protein [Pelagibius sp. 7325]|uniref:hypothetical protein n=1 Tax=Pelagibius sp. 7325 TaxID=3131994 RepID=UPI0030ECB3B0
MLALDSSRWAELTDAYGGASRIPILLEKAAQNRSADGDLWSSLCHQGDVYTASYAALPHLVEVARSGVDRTAIATLDLIGAIEVARLQGKGPAMPGDLAHAYNAALSVLPEIAARLLIEPRSEEECRVILGALAAAKGHPQLSAAIFELSPDIADRLLGRWLFE